MLVLKRRFQEKIVINGPCEITVVEVRGGAVRLGIDADKSVTIFRKELLDGLDGTNQKEPRNDRR